MNLQLSMFADETVELARDSEGGIRYYPGCVPQSLTTQWFSELRGLIPWQSDKRPMYDRIVDVPRLMASVNLNDPDCPPCIKAAQEAVQKVAPAPYNRVGLNLYRDQHDSVAMHNDRVDDLLNGCPIAIFSLGATRDMLIRAKKGGPSQRIALASGSVLVMSYASQYTHDHGIPKCTNAQMPRISLAFRGRLNR
ncbi:alpha-ketoglutarate-dependent dioxygenase AlkB [Ottowia thiooxydans]|uniref:Alkylated DNA repair dioxygenase AlkB n=1 Tax=Ottowia thiooxydans TaxID=219182 RepID=A0ABV2Q7I7_9BURK